MLLGETNRKAGLGEGVSPDFTIPAAITDTGCERELNEDRYAVIECESGLAWLVCDGMGGSTGGELAAQLAIDAIRRDLERLPYRPAEAALRSAILEANRVIVLRRQNQAFAQMGTTIVSGLFNGPELVIGHVGDSRAYLVRDRAIQQLTTDHTYVQELVDKGQIKLEEALNHAQSHILTRCIGSEPALEVDVQRFWVWKGNDSEAGDLLLLCTDGLYSLVREGEMANIISENPPQGACVKLVELAKSRGGYDNITLSIIPLKGQLKQEPPVGYSEKRSAGVKRKKVDLQPPERSLLKVFVIGLMLSVMASLLVVALVILRSAGE